MSDTTTETAWCTPDAAHMMTQAAPDVFLGYSGTGRRVYRTGDTLCYHCGAVRPGSVAVENDNGTRASFSGWTWPKPLPGTCRHQSNIERAGDNVRCLDCNTVSVGATWPK